MARHRQPLEVAALRGSIRRNPKRYRATAPKSALPLGEVPTWLSPGAKLAWHELAERATAGVLTGADRIAMEVLSVLVDQLRAGPRAMPAARIGHMVGLLARLGFTPADRQQAPGANEPKHNPFNQF